MARRVKDWGKSAVKGSGPPLPGGAAPAGLVSTDHEDRHR